MTHAFSQRITYWLGVIAVGLVVGIGIQTALAWNNPSSTPPSSNVPGPLTTGATGQSKGGNLVLNTGGTYYYGLSANGFVQGLSGLCMGADCQSSWSNAVKAGSDVYYAASDWYQISCDAVGHWETRADCPTGTRPVNCGYDYPTNGSYENGDEYYQIFHDTHSDGEQLGFWYYWGLNSTIYSRFTFNIIPAGSRVNGEPVSQNGACQMWYFCDGSATSGIDGATMRTRAICVPANTSTVENPYQSGSGTLTYP